MNAIYAFFVWDEMRLRQLQLFSQAVDCGLNISLTARRAHTSQPSVSRHLQSLEKQIGTPIFVRSKRKISGLTSTGREVLDYAKRVLHDIDTIGELGKNSEASQQGSITIAASHTYARYALPDVIRTFMARYPKVRLVLRQGDPQQIMTWASNGDADLAICAEAEDRPKDLVFFSCNQHERIILAPRNHPLAKVRKPTLHQLSQYSLITYDAKFAIYWRILEVFEAKGLSPNIVLTATDVDVMKTYVRSGLGIAVVASLAYSKAEDTTLVAISANHLFEPVAIKIGLRKGAFLRSFVYDFIEIFAPALRREKIQLALAAK